ncbi:MAG: energy transducer TonB [Betaproteobacteria bacterium]|nr:energy transducer TonB [Betaproteobacteria bacterium]
MNKDRVLPWAVSLSFLVHALALAQLHLRGAAVPPSDPLTMTVQLMPPAAPASAASPPRPQARPIAAKPAAQAVLTNSAELIPVAAPPAKPMEAPAAAVAMSAAPVAANAPAQAAASQQLVIAPPRFDAEYLDNPRPVYPAMSRRLGEEGRVLLRVLVGGEGRARAVQLKEGSGFARLDQAAREAVLRWRFVPARRGGEAVEGWVLVPIGFALN